MAQIKKEGVRDAILEAAFRLFSTQGYNDSSIPAIAREAGMSTANVYVYFKSKLEILYTLYEPWLEERLEKMGRSLAKIEPREARLEKLLVMLWRDLPRENNGFAKNIMQALSASRGDDDYSPHLRELFQGRVAAVVSDCLSIDAADGHAISGILLMAFDGFAMNVHLKHGVAFHPKAAKTMVRLLLKAR